MQKLEFLMPIYINPSSERFIAEEICWTAEYLTNQIPVRALCNNFDRWMKGKIESKQNGSELTLWKLNQSTVVRKIVESLGGTEQVKITYYEMIEFLKSVEGSGLYLFFLADAFDIIRAVYAQWDQNGWNIFADHLESTSYKIKGLLVIGSARLLLAN